MYDKCNNREKAEIEIIIQSPFGIDGEGLNMIVHIFRCERFVQM